MTANNRVCAMAISAVLLVAPAAHASLAVAATFDQKVANAAAIVLGKCVRQESRFDPSGRWILTYSTFQVEKTMKGSAMPEITIVTPGGQVGSLHQTSSGIPAFRPGAENVIFVKSSNLGATVLYFDQGAYDVKSDEHGQLIVTPVPSNLAKTMKGSAMPEITIVTPGGQVGSLHQTSSGIPAFRPGAENVIFVKSSNLGATVLYFDQGAYDVKSDEHGQRIVTPVPSNLVK